MHFFLKATAIFSKYDFLKIGDRECNIGINGSSNRAFVNSFVLTRQTAANIEEQIKNDIDIILALINQLDNELDKFYTKPVQTGVENDLIETGTGLKGLIHFASEYNSIIP